MKVGHASYGNLLPNLDENLYPKHMNYFITRYLNPLKVL